MSDDVTEADRATAHALWNEILCNGGVPGWTATGAIAAALAAERAKTREPFLAWAAEVEEVIDVLHRAIPGSKPHDQKEYAEMAAAAQVTVDRIRRAVEEQQ